MHDDIRTNAQRNDDRKAAQEDRIGPDVFVKVAENARGQGSDLKRVTGQPKHSIEDRLFTELTRASEFAEADAAVVSYSFEVKVELASGEKLSVKVPA
jgi:hypothetical protein